MIQVIGITGYKRSGKGLVAGLLTDALPDKRVYQVGFADKVKQLGAMALGIEGDPRDLIELMDEVKLGWYIEAYAANAPASFYQVTGREYLQHLGTSGRALFGEDFWVNQVLPRTMAPLRNLTSRELALSDARYQLEQKYPNIDIVAITDLRFENEAQRVKDVGGVVWEVTRPGVESDGHASEQRLRSDLLDWRIVNDGTLDDLRALVSDAVAGTLS